MSLSSSCSVSAAASENAPDLAGRLEEAPSFVNGRDEGAVWGLVVEALPLLMEAENADTIAFLVCCLDAVALELELVMEGHS